MGVSAKQADKARLSFDRSAQQAGFFARGKERLIMPVVGDTPEPKKKEDEKPPGGGGGGGGDAKGLHPFVQGLLKTLPEPGTEWTAADQAKWLQTAASIFGLIYPSSGKITVTSEGN